MADSVQVTLIQIDNYGPWTGTLGNDREPRLQILQAELYSAIERAFSEKGGLVFFNRFDEMVAVSNSITIDEHRAIQKDIEQKFPVTVSMGIGIADTPFQAQLKASKLLQEEGSAHSPSRTNALAYETHLDSSEASVQIVHFDVDSITQTHTDTLSAYETASHIITLYGELMQLFRKHDALLFYVGGDNFMGIANGLSRRQIDSIIEYYRGKGIPLKCGIGNSRTGREAAELATMNLDRIRRSNGAKTVLSCASV